MKEQRQGLNQRLQQIWISQTKKEVFFSKVGEYERVEFKKHEELMEYVRACVECGYKIG
ncbi:MAG: hypothetical protein PHG07_10990 [Lachnospiraceae bacterium]|nr:hypothetical protein [Lachnospiraceae bacterium]